MRAIWLACCCIVLHDAALPRQSRRAKSQYFQANVWCCRCGLNTRPLPYQGTASWENLSLSRCGRCHAGACAGADRVILADTGCTDGTRYLPITRQPLNSRTPRPTYKARHSRRLSVHSDRRASLAKEEPQPRIRKGPAVDHFRSGRRRALPLRRVPGLAQDQDGGLAYREALAMPSSPQQGGAQIFFWTPADMGRHRPIHRWRRECQPNHFES
jgi:hypothetical protein